MSALIRFVEGAPVIAPKDGRVFAPLAEWLTARSDAVLLGPSDDPYALGNVFQALTAIAVEFPKPTDGRGFSIARLLRERLGWHGELRAVGAVAHDQLAFMHRCGFDALELRDGEDPEACLRAFGEVGVLYQGAWDERRPLFRRRAEALAALKANP